MKLRCYRSYLHVVDGGLRYESEWKVYLGTEQGNDDSQQLIRQKRKIRLM